MAHSLGEPGGLVQARQLRADWAKRDYDPFRRDAAAVAGRHRFGPDRSLAAPANVNRTPQRTDGFKGWQRNRARAMAVPADAEGAFGLTMWIRLWMSSEAGIWTAAKWLRRFGCPPGIRTPIC